MIEICPNLFIGSSADFENGDFHDWTVIHACKEPYHRKALGYTSFGAPKEDPEYLLAKRGNEISVNLVDAKEEKYIPKDLVDLLLELITASVENGKTLVHCNKGESRAPALGLLYMGQQGLLPTQFHDASDKFREIYPAFFPGTGMLLFLVHNWDRIVNG